MLKLLDIAAHEGKVVPFDGIKIPVPPLDVEELGNDVGGESVLEEFGGVAGDNGIRGNILGDDGAGGDDGAVADLDSGEDGGVSAKPYVVSDDGVTFGFGFLKPRCESLGRGEDVPEWVGGEGVELVIGVGADELGAKTDGTKLADDEFFSSKRVGDEATEHFLSFEMFHVGVSEVTDFNTGVIDHVFQEDVAFARSIDGVGI